MDKDTLFFSNLDLKRMIVPLFLEQLLAMLVGVADTFMVSYAGDAAVSGVSLVNMAVTIFIYLFTALAASGAVVASQYIGNQNREAANRSAGQLLLSSALISVIAMAPMLIWGGGSAQAPFSTDRAGHNGRLYDLFADHRFLLSRSGGLQCRRRPVPKQSAD